jgi:hypothetical protein
MGGGEAKTVSLALPDTITEIANASLAGFTSLKTLTASGVHTVGDYAFANCTALETVKLPKATAIGNYAFNGCSALETVNISGIAQVGQILTAVASLGGSGNVSYQWVRGETDISGATQETYTLTADDEGKTIKVRASRAGYAGSISSEPTATVAADFAEFTSVAALKTYLAGHSGGTSADEPIPLKLSGVALSAADMTSLFTALGAAGKYVGFDLSGCTGLTEWAKYTYAGAGKIVSLVLPDSVCGITSVPYIFSSFTSLKTLAASGVQTVGDYAFYQRTSLASISLPAATAIGDYAFSGCSALTSISLLAATTIGDYAFHDCSELASLTLGTVIPTLGTSVFYDAGKNTAAGFTIYVPNEAAKAALEAAIEIDSIINRWWWAFYTTNIGNGKFKGVEVTPQ